MEDELKGVKESRKLSMMHTAEHIFFKSLEKQVEGLKLEKIKLDKEESSLFVMAEGLSWDIIFRAEQEANQIIRENRKVNVHETIKADIGKFPGLRIKLERIEDETVRVIEIENHDFSACSGKHCETTAEVKNLLVTKFRKAQTGYEIRFKVDAEKELFEMASTARLAIETLGAEQDKIIPTINNLKADIENLKKAMKSQKIEVKEDKIGGLLFVYNTFEDMDKKLLIDKANELMKEKTVLCFLNKTDTLQVMIMVSEDSGKDASAIIKALNEKFGGKGGGKQAFAMCSVDEQDTEKVLKEVKEMIS
ncbi:MAG: DHHA1 domain-containing protein [Nanoarchaeota archaeon]